MAINTGITYYLLKKDERGIKLYASDLWDSTKEHGSSLVEKIDEYFDEGTSRESLS